MILASRLRTSLRFLISCSAVLALFLISVLPALASDPQEFWRQGSADFEPDLFSGASSYNVPIVLPEGRLGLTPELGLNYSSMRRANNSMVGYGWDVPMNRIVRHTETGIAELYDDGVFALELNGSYLKLSDETLTSGEYGTYTAEVETPDTFYDITFNSDDSWSVNTKQGLELTFGSATDARIDDPSDSTRIYAWYLEEIRDPNDNYIRYTYYMDDPVLYPETIVYTGNGTTDGPFTVRFEPFASGTPSSRSDIIPIYEAGFELSYEYLLESIEVDVDSEGTVAAYDLTYATGDNGYRSLLESVTRNGLDSDGNTIALEPWEFTYTEATDSWTEDTSYTFPEISVDDNKSAIGDFNGDGMADIILLREASGGSGYDHRFWTGGTEEFENVLADWTLPNMVFDGAYSIVSDLNGDGFTDFAKSHNATRGTYEVQLSDGESSFTDVSSSWSVPTQFDFNYYYLGFGDLNGDGLMDILAQRDCSGGSCSTSYVFESDGETGWTDVTSDYSLPYQEYSATTRLLDLNGDGLSDWITATNSGGSSHYFRIHLNVGDGTFEEVTSDWTIPSNFAFPNSGTGSAYTLYDVNGDGILDIYRSETEVYIGFGQGWGSVETHTDGITNSSMVRLVDISGDGMADQFLVDWTGGFSGYWRTQLMIRDGDPPDLLETIKTPEGATITYSYTGSLAEQDGAGDPRNPELPLAVSLVDSVMYEDGLGNSETTSYTYDDGAFVSTDVYDGRFAGFHQVTKTYDDGDYEITYYHQGGGEDGSTQGEVSDHYDKIGRVYRQEWYESDGTLLQVTITGWDRDELTSDQAFVAPYRELTMTYNADGSHRDTGKRFYYDSYGNVWQTIELGEVNGYDNGAIVDTGTDKRAVTTNYVTTSSPYLVGLPYVRTHYDNSWNQVAKERWIYDGVTLGTATTGNVTKYRQLIDDDDHWSDIFSVYDSYGNAWKVTDDNGNRIRYYFDSWGMYAETVRDELGNDTDIETDLTTGLQTKVTDPNGTITEWDVDTLGRVEEERRSSATSATTLETIATYSYDTSSTPQSVTTTRSLDGTTSTTSIEYTDGLGRLVQTRSLLEDGGYGIIDTMYDDHGRVDEVSLPYAGTGTSYSTPSTSAETLTTAYDGLGRMTSVSDSVGTKSYSYEGWETTVTDEEGNEMRYQYDALGRLAEVTQVDNANDLTTTYTYNELDLLTSLTDPDGNERAFEYDYRGKRTSAEMLHDAAETTYGTWTYAYDEVGNLTSTTNPNGDTTTYAYDELNRIETIDSDSVTGMEVTYTYDTSTNGIGRVATMTRDDIEIAYAYDERGAVKDKTYTIESTDYTTTLAYDRQGNVTSTTYPDGSIFTTAYNQQGLAESAALDSTSIVDDIDYNANSQVTTMEFTNGVTTTNTYDDAQRYWLTDRVTTDGTNTWQDLSYTFDDVGNITTLVDASDLDTAMAVTYGYDDLYRLTSASTSGSGASAGDYSYSYTYDDLGNMTSSPRYGTMTYGDTANPHAVTALDSVTWTYDDNGNLVSDGTNIYAWTFLNELASYNDGTDTTTYHYDADGDRVIKEDASGDKTLYLGDYVYAESDDSEELHLSVAGVPVFELHRAFDSTETENTIHTDHLGSVAVMTDSSGTWTSARDYYPYGDERVHETQGSGTDNRFDFTNKERDDESGLMYVEARYLSTDAARFISIDPLFLDPVSKNWFADPQQQNAYSYARNNPIYYVDPLGESVTVYIERGKVSDGIKSSLGHTFVDVSGSTYSWGPGEGAMNYNSHGIDLGVVGTNYYLSQEGKNADSFTAYTFDTTAQQESQITDYYQGLTDNYFSMDETPKASFSVLGYNCTDVAIEALASGGLVNSDFGVNRVATPSALDARLNQKYESQQSSGFVGRVKNWLNRSENSQVSNISNRQEIKTGE